MEHDDLATLFGRYAAATTFDSLPAEAVRAAKYSTLDTLGVILGASGLMDAARPVVDLTREMGGAPESTLFGFGGKLPAVSAAFVNGSMGHGLDFDDHLPEGHHPSVTVLPALIALAERSGGVSGTDLLTALAVGQDLFARLRKNVAWKQDWFITPVIGTLASAAAAAKLLGCTAEQIANAIGIACTQSASTMQTAYGTGGDLRGMYGGFAAKAAAYSALLAQRGIQATAQPLEGNAGFLPVYFGDWDREAMLAGLGQDFQGETILYKLWPSCGVTHAYIDTALRLLGGPGRTDEIERIEVFGGDFAQKLSEPAEFRRRPPTSNDAKFSIPYTLGLALLNGTVGVGDFTQERRTDPRVYDVASRVEFKTDTKYDWTDELPPGAVRIVLKDGSELFGEAKHEDTPGSVHNRLDWEQLTVKFRDCADHAVRPFTDADITEMISVIGELENVADTTTLTRLLG